MRNFFAERRSGNDRKVPPRLFISCLCIIITGKILSLSRETSRPTRAPGPEKIGGKARKGAMGLNSGTLLKFCPFFRKRFVYGKEIFYLILIDCYIFLQGMALSVLAGSPFRPAPGPGGTENPPRRTRPSLAKKYNNLLILDKKFPFHKRSAF